MFLQIHLDLAKYHELNRFVKENEPFDKEAAIYHLSQAAKCGCLEAIKTMAQLHLGLPHDTLPGIQVLFVAAAQLQFLGHFYLRL